MNSTVNILRSNEVKSLFLDKKGFPVSEKLLALDDICKAVRKPMPQSQPERGYALSRNIRTINSVKQFFINHNVLFIAPRIEGITYYGLSKKQEYKDNYLMRLTGITKSHKIIENKIKHLSNGQLPLFDNEQSLLPAK